MNSQKQRAGRTGGLATVARYGREHMRQIARTPTMDELRQQRAQRFSVLRQEVCAPLAIREQRRLFKLRQALTGGSLGALPASPGKEAGRSG